MKKHSPLLIALSLLALILFPSYAKYTIFNIILIAVVCIVLVYYYAGDFKGKGEHDKRKMFMPLILYLLIAIIAVYLVLSRN